MLFRTVCKASTMVTCSGLYLVWGLSCVMQYYVQIPSTLIQLMVRGLCRGNRDSSECIHYHHFIWTIFILNICDVIYHKILWNLSMMSSGQLGRLKIPDNQRIFLENMFNFAVSIVPADGLGTRTSVRTAMTKFRSHVYMGPAFEGWTF